METGEYDTSPGVGNRMTREPSNWSGRRSQIAHNASSDSGRDSDDEDCCDGATVDRPYQCEECESFYPELAGL